MDEGTPPVPDQAIAVVGLAGRFPGARDVRELWRNLRSGVESVRFLSEVETRAAGVDPVRLRDPAYVRAAAVVEDFDCFDAGFFGVSPREAERMDPQHRLFLETCWHALEDAGCDPGRHRGVIGVFAGSSPATYAAARSKDGDDEPSAHLQRVLADGADFLATRVSYKLDLRGPSMTVQTSCSTSLVAVHLACQSLLGRECDLALAGGVSVVHQATAGYAYRPEGIYSQDGHCRAFDSHASGTVGGMGVAVVALRRLRDAIVNGDPIRAVILGSAVNNDGARKVGFTAPSVPGQAEVVVEALATAEVDPETIGYVEAHGTGTALGDPVEVAALTQAFRTWTKKRGYCALGSIKTNLGHLDAAAGVTGLFKAVLALEHGEIPASLHFEHPNPAIELASSPFYVNTRLRRWERGYEPRRAGVSSFGMGGTNVHLILEEAPQREVGPRTRPAELFLLSARTSTALERAASEISRLFEEEPAPDLADVAHTLQTGRRQFSWRRFWVCGSSEQALSRLSDKTGTVGPEPPSVAFVFSGQGKLGMGLGLYRTEAVFRDALDRCAELFRPELGIDLREVLYPRGASKAEAEVRLREALLIEPALFVVELALARLLMDWGVRPEALIGDGIGEYVAACVANVLAEAEAIHLVAARAHLLQALPRGAMLVIPLRVEELLPFLGEEISLAAVTAPDRSVVSGPSEAVAALERQLADRSVRSRRLETPHALHSSMTEPALEPFLRELRKVQLRPPEILFVSNVSGTWIRPEEAVDPAYWARHLQAAMRFHDGLETLSKKSGRVNVLVCPGTARRTRGLPQILPSIGAEPTHEVERVLEALGELWLRGVEIDWVRFRSGEKRRKVSLPPYPFERSRYWLKEADRAGDSRVRRRGVEDWLYAPSWRRGTPATPLAGRSIRVLIGDGSSLARDLVKRLEDTGERVLLAEPGDRFARLEGGSYQFRPGHAEDLERLVGELDWGGTLPKQIAYLWTGSGIHAGLSRDELLARVTDFGLCGPLFLSRALEKAGALPARVDVVTRGVYEVVGDEQLDPLIATIVGPCRSAPHEIPGLGFRHIDISVPAGAAVDQTSFRALLAELHADAAEATVAIRGCHRWLPSFDRLAASSAGAVPRLREGGVYIVLGGLGGVGLEAAAFLARKARPRLALIGRSGLPAPARGASVGPPDRVLERLRQVEQDSAGLLVLSADVEDPDSLRGAVRVIEDSLGPIHGVIHAAGAEKAFTTVREATRSDWEGQLRPKLLGVLAVDEVFADHSLDFCILMSSLASVLGAAGLPAYAAAAAFLDAFAWSRRRGVPNRWCAIDWDHWLTWKDPEPQLSPAEAVHCLSPEEAAAAFEEILRQEPMPQLLVSTGDLAARRRRWVVDGSIAAAPRAQLATPATAVVSPRTPTEHALATIWAEVLGVEGVGIHDNFFDLGGDSVLGMQIVSKARGWGLRLDPVQVFECQTIAELAAVATEGTGRSQELREVSHRLVPLTPIQHWFFERKLAEPSRFNLAVALELAQEFPTSVLREALAALWGRHDALRLSFPLSGGGPQRIAETRTGDIRVEEIDLSHLSADEVEAAIAGVAEGIHGSLDLSDGPLTAAARIGLGDGQPARLLWVCHHLAVDEDSWRILLDDLERSLGARLGGLEPRWGAVTAPFGQWAHTITEVATSAKIARDLEYWLSRPWDRDIATPLDRRAGPNTFGSARTVSLALDARETHALLKEAPKRTRARPEELLVTALAVAIASWRGDPHVGLHLEREGRDALADAPDVSRTVGWFTTLVPVTLEVNGTTPVDALRTIKEELRRIPNGGMGYGLLRYCRCDDPATAPLRRVTSPDVGLVYLGSLEAPESASLFRRLPAAPGSPCSPRAVRPHLLDVVARVVAGRLRLEWTFSESIHRRQTVEKLADEFCSALAVLARESRLVLDSSDFPAARLDPRDLEKLAADLSETRRPK